MTAGKAGCRDCSHPQSVPKWLYSRAMQARDRCENTRNKAYERYGARGIQLKFRSPMAMALWVQDNLGLHKELELDRLDNEGHYEAGNLRYLTRKQNQANTRKRRLTPAMHLFRQKHPEIKYADATLVRLIGEGLTDAEIIERYNRPSSKPKGVYGTFSTPDPVIASQSRDS